MIKSYKGFVDRIDLKEDGIFTQTVAGFPTNFFRQYNGTVVINDIKLVGCFYTKYEVPKNVIDPFDFDYKYEIRQESDKGLKVYSVSKVKTK